MIASPSKLFSNLGYSWASSAISSYGKACLPATWTSGVPTNAAYQVLIDVEMAGPNTKGWHTVADPVNFPGPYQLNVTDVQIYNR